MNRYRCSLVTGLWNHQPLCTAGPPGTPLDAVISRLTSWGLAGDPPLIPLPTS